MISANPDNWNHAAFLAESGRIDWKKKNNYEIGDIVYIYNTKTSKVMFKTFVEQCSSRKNNDDDWVIFRLIEYVDNDDLSLEHLRNHGLKNPPQRAMKVNDDLENYIDSFFDNDSKYEIEKNRMWVVKAGENGVKINTFKKNNFVAIGWEFGDLTGKNKGDIKNLCDEQGFAGNSSYQIDMFVNEMEFGDYILSYDPSNEEYYIGKCISDYYYSKQKDDSGDDIQYKNCRDVVWLDKTLNRKDLSQRNRKFIDSPGSVREINDEFTLKKIKNFYNFNFLSNEKRNLIFFGAPGTGKSFKLNEEKDTLLKKYGVNIEDHCERVTFHPDYTYSNFVGTYKPVSENEITYKFVFGPFMRTLIKALNNPYEPFVLIIEEINRANVAAVFGDVFQLLDRDEFSNSEYPINSSEEMRKYIMLELRIPNIPEYRINTFENYLKSIIGYKFDKLRIPSNMFIWATMNSADQGVFTMDTAFKRRWNFEYLGIDDGEEKIENLKFELNEKEYSWNKLRRAINNVLVKDYNINEDKLLGPFFAFTEYIDEDKPSIRIPTEKFKDIFKNKIIMYLFEDVAKSRRNELFDGVEKNSNLTYSQICQKFENDGIEIFCENILNNLDK